MSNTEEEQNTEEAMLIPFPPMGFTHCVLKDKSTDHQCTYIDYQVKGIIFFYESSEKYITNTCTHQIHHVCNIK